jgi:integrase
MGAPARPLTPVEQTLLGRVFAVDSPRLTVERHQQLRRLVDPIERATCGWDARLAVHARKLILAQVHRRQQPWWAWDEDAWLELTGTRQTTTNRQARLHLVALAHRLGGYRRLHRRAGVLRMHALANLVFAPEAVDAALAEVRAALLGWGIAEATMSHQVGCAVCDLLLACDSTDLATISGEELAVLVSEYPRGERRNGLVKVSRVLAHKGIIPQPLKGNDLLRGHWPQTLASVPAEWLAWAQRWRRLTTHEPGTVRGMFSIILVAGRWAADTHPEAVSPDRWTRDIAAEYVADTLVAVRGQWAPNNRNRASWGQPLTARGKATRMDALRSFFCDLIEWEWITPRFDPRRVLSLPLSVRAQIGPNPRIIDEATWAKLMAAGLTLNTEDLKEYATPAARQADGDRRTFYPIEMVRALVGTWLFAGLRIDEIRRLEVDCVTWDQGTEEQTGQPYPICLLHVPQNKTSGPFNKPVDPIVGQLIGAWQQVRLPQPLLADRKTGQHRQFLFCYRGQLVGAAYLNDHLIPALCHKAGIPQADSRGALTSHRARATIATQLLNAPEPLSLPDLQQWLGHKHPASTRHYAAILQRTLTAAYRKADYFARNLRTIQVLVDRDSILSGAAAGGGQPWKYYDLGEGWCTYDFFAKCPHRLACARCPFYLPKQSHAGQLLAVRDGIQQMLEQLELTDDERAALEGDRDAVAALANRLADTPTPAGPTPNELGTEPAFISLTALRDTLPGGRS